MKLFRWWVVGIWIVLAGCAIHKPNGQFVSPLVYTSEGQQGGSGKIGPLRQQYQHWQGTPYRLGGASKAGIDCSALVMHIFRDAFDTYLPRTTAGQVKMGKPVRQPRVGDLVFFRTGWRQRHVGVFMGDNQFLHASVSKGVTVSRLDDPYWQQRFWQTRRVL